MLKFIGEILYFNFIYPIKKAITHRRKRGYIITKKMKFRLFILKEYLILFFVLALLVIFTYKFFK